MSDRLITAEEAQKRLSELEAMSDWTGEDRIAAEYARTVIAQAEQIKRLQKAAITLLADLNEAEFAIHQDYGTRSTPPFEPHTLDEYITAEDMEEK